ncbi:MULTISPECIES: Ms4533A family Cys-rich leader peptide [Nocardiaceae]|nr:MULTISPECIES: Ms4533A family Cys-rich leader peptide [Rhodococcus]
MSSAAEYRVRHQLALIAVGILAVADIDCC